MKHSVQFILFFVFCLCGFSVLSEVKLTPELAAGRLKAMQVCSNCHGLDGQSGSGGNSSISPNIGAQQKDYLIARLKDYKSGKIQHPQMSLIAQMLSEQDIDNVSEWYSRIKIDSPLFEQQSLASGEQATKNQSPEIQAGKLKADQVCSNCHGLYGQAGSGGNSTIVPNLTAQQKEYLILKLKEYRSGRIEHAQMSLIAKMLTDDDINNVATWYSSIEITVSDPEVEISQ